MGVPQGGKKPRVKNGVKRHASEAANAAAQTFPVFQAVMSMTFASGMIQPVFRGRTLMRAR